MAALAPSPGIITSIHIPRDVLELLRRVAVERANAKGGRPSVSAALLGLVRDREQELRAEAGR